ncbi:SMC5 [Enterospora canceri]|uniref:Structural maintenance of chromosomes protein 5 n=1 Tax=Enterospora canceri TaxID=1081671 RepID=A0A1Y1S6E0_9MICR|nr:SMC5 [Enterospora canceri]
MFDKPCSFKPDRVRGICYSPGNIVYMRLTNFQTFSDQEFYFSEKLNLIAAPNGTGKSSLANAIAFVFNGTTRTIGKTKDVLDFIKFKEEKAEIICVVAQKPNGVTDSIKKQKTGNYVEFRRVIQRKRAKAESIFYIDETQRNSADYGAFIGRMKIDCDNLTNFLPQERVAEFVRMSGDKMFNEVMKDVLMGEKWTIGEKLGEFEKTKKELDGTKTNLESSNKQFTLLEQKKTMLEKEVDKIREFEIKQREIRVLQYKEFYLRKKKEMEDMRGWKEVLDGVISTKDDNEKQIGALVEIVGAAEESTMMKEFYAKVEIYLRENVGLRELVGKMEEYRREYVAFEREQERKKQKNREIEKENEAVEEKRAILVEKIGEELRSYVGSFDRFVNEGVFEITIENQPVSRTNKMKELSLNEIRTNLTKSINECTEQTVRRFQLRDSAGSDALERIQRLKMTALQNKKLIEAHETERIRFNEKAGQRLMRLRSYHEDTYRAVEHLRRNQIGVEFYEPAFLHIEIDEEFRTEIEALLNFQALSSFLVKSNSDMKKMARILKDELRLGVNICTLTEETSLQSKFNSPEIDGSATDFITCNPIYKHFFNTYGRFNEIPISKKEINEKALLSKYPFVRKMIINQKLVEIKRNKYNSEAILKTDRIREMGIFRSSSPNTGDLERLESELKELKNKRNQIQAEMGHEMLKKQQIDERRATITQLNEKINEKYFVIKRCIDKHFTTSERSLYDLSSGRGDECRRLFKNALSKMTEFKLHRINYNQAKETEMNITNNKMQIETLKTATVALVEEVTRVRVKIREKGEMVGNYQAMMDEMEANESARNRKMTRRANLTQTQDGGSRLSLIQVGSQQSQDALFQFAVSNQIGSFREEINRNQANSLNEVMQRRSYLDEIVRGNDLDESVKQAYTTAERDWGRMAEEKKSYELALIGLEKKADKIRDAIRTGATNHVGPISSRFGQMLSRLGNQGELRVVCDSGAGRELAKFELQIWVRFKEGENLQQLTSFRQSGGEKSLSTMLFLLALQSGTDNFRLVDEINQGMDQNNEKRVFEILNLMTGQFFIITPKLISDIEYSENYNVLILYGGTGTKEVERL